MAQTGRVRTSCGPLKMSSTGQAASSARDAFKRTCGSRSLLPKIESTEANLFAKEPSLPVVGADSKKPSSKRKSKQATHPAGIHSIPYESFGNDPWKRPADTRDTCSEPSAKGDQVSEFEKCSNPSANSQKMGNKLISFTRPWKRKSSKISAVLNRSLSAPKIEINPGK